MPDCPEEVGLEEYNLTIKGSNFPVNVAYKVDLPKNVGTSVYNSEVLAPVTSRIIAVKVAQSSNLGELRSLTLTLVEESEGPGNGPRGGSPTP